MDKGLNKLIRQKMRDCGVWNFTVNTKVYTTVQFINEFGDKMPNDLITLLKDNISHLQYYFDDRVLVPIENVIGVENE